MCIRESEIRIHITNVFLPVGKKVYAFFVIVKEELSCMCISNDFPMIYSCTRQYTAFSTVSEKPYENQRFTLAKCSSHFMKNTTIFKNPEIQETLKPFCLQVSFLCKFLKSHQ